jgi:glycosyltransferase involved in cell wall biosynthesis
MKIALVYDAIYPFMQGGAERRYFELGRCLAQDDEVHLLGWQFWTGPTVRKFAGMWLRGVGPPVPFYGPGGRRSAKEAVAFACHLLRALVREQFDIIDCSSIPYLSVFASRLGGARRRTPLVVTWHEYMGRRRWREYLGASAGGGSAFGGGALPAALIERLCACVGQARIAVSAFTARRLPGRRPIVLVVPNGVDYQAIQAAPAAPEGPDILFVGRLLAHKRVDILLQAVRDLDGAGYTCGIVGTGPEEDRLRALANSLGLDGRVRFYGQLRTADEVYGLMKASRVFALPSEQEGFSISVVEAQACGLPPVVVAARDSAAAGLIRPGVDGLVCEKQPLSLATALAGLLQDPELRHQLSVGARAAAAALDWSAAAGKVQRLYQTLARGGSAGPGDDALSEEGSHLLRAA